MRSMSPATPPNTLWAEQPKTSKAGISAMKGVAGIVAQQLAPTTGSDDGMGMGMGDDSAATPANATTPVASAAAAPSAASSADASSADADSSAAASDSSEMSSMDGTGAASTGTSKSHKMTKAIMLAWMAEMMAKMGVSAHKGMTNMEGQAE
jgi:hypothetical protein